MRYNIGVVISKLKLLPQRFKTAIKQRVDNSSNHIVALDIGTEFVKALIGKIEDGQIKVLGVGRQRQSLSDMHSGAIADIAGVVANCNNALTEAESKAGVSARRAIIGIAGELVKGNTSTIRYKRANKNEEISVEEMERIIHRVQKRAYEQARRQVAWETGNEDVDIKLVNSAIVSIHIDSYKVSNPIGFQGKDVAVQIYTAFAPIVHIGALERVASELDLELLAVAAEPFAVARSVIGDDASSDLSAVLLDVGGGTTDIAVVNDGGVEGTKMFGIGGRAFTKTISNDLDIDFDEAEAIKLQLGGDKLEEEIRHRVLKAISKTLSVWIEGVKLALDEFDAIDHLPNSLLLCGGGASLGELVDILEETNWYTELPFTKKPSIRLIEPTQVVGILDTTNRLRDHTYITAMGLLRVGLDTLASDDNVNRPIRDKLNQLLRI